MIKPFKIPVKPVELTFGRLFYFILLSMGVQLGYAQVNYTVDLNAMGRDRYFEASKLIAPVFKLNSDEIETYEGFGVEAKKPLQKFKVKLPDLSGCLDTGYSFLFSEVSEKSSNGYTAVLIANYSRRHLPAIIFVDHNNNYDFTDDGTPDTFHLIQHYIDIKLKNPERPEQFVTFRWSRFPFTKDLSFKRMADELFHEYSGSKTFVGTTLSFREQRFNIKTAHCVAGNDSFQVSMQDMNYNGLYNEPGIDRILINPWGTEIVGTDFSFDIQKKVNQTTFERNYKSYRVISLDDYGRQLSFQHQPEVQAERQLKVGKKVPNFKFVDSDGKTRKLRKFRRKPVYIYFWNRNQPNFESDTSYLRLIHEKYGQQIRIIALNYGDNPKALNSYVEVNGVAYLCGISTKLIAQKFLVESIPQGFVLKKRRRLYHNNMNPNDLLILLESGEFK